MRTLLIPLKDNLRAALEKQKEVINYNLAALRFIQLQDNNQRNATLLETVSDEDKITELRQNFTGDKKRKHISIHV